MKVRVSLLLLAASLLSASLSEARNEDVLLGIAEWFDPVPWAGNRYSSAVITSPGWLGMEERPELTYGQVQSKGILNRDNVLYVRSRGFGFGTESFHWTSEIETRKYVVALGRPITKKVGIALSYAWHSSEESDLNGLTSWDAGLAYKPHWRFDFSLTGRNLARTDFGTAKLGRIVEGGVRGWVWDQEVSLYTQVRHFRGEGWEELEPVFGIEYFTPIDVLILRARADRDNRALGMELNFNAFTIGFHYRFIGGGQDGSLAYIKLHPPQRERR